MLALTETKFIENGVVSCCSVQEMERAGEDVAILLNDYGSAVIYFGCISSRILWIKFKFSRVKVCVLIGYGPSAGDGEERERFCNYTDKILERV